MKLAMLLAIAKLTVGCDSVDNIHINCSVECFNDTEVLDERMYVA